MSLYKLLLIVLLLAVPQPARAVVLVDQLGRQVNLPALPKRVVALAPSIVEIVFELGASDRLVGATEYSDFPAAAKQLPRVGSYVRPDVERIVALKPDLCLAIKDGNPEYMVTQLAGFGIPVYVIDPRSINDIIDVIDRYGHLLGVRERSQQTVIAMRSRLAAVAARLARTSTKPLVFFQIDAAPIISAGTGTFINELITLAGGRNVAAGATPYPHFNWEDILHLQPEVVMVASMAGGHSVQDLVAGWQKWRQIPAVKNSRVHVVDANLIDRPTPRLLDGLEAFARIIHPDSFGSLDDH